MHLKPDAGAYDRGESKSEFAPLIIIKPGQEAKDGKELEIIG